MKFSKGVPVVLLLSGSLITSTYLRKLLQPNFYVIYERSLDKACQLLLTTTIDCLILDEKFELN